MIYIDESINYNKELFIFGKPIETPYGIIRFLTYEEYLMNTHDLSIISMNVLHLYYQYRNFFEKTREKEALDALEEFKKLHLFDIVQEDTNLKLSYINIFNIVFDKNENIDFNLLFSDKDIFMFIRKLIMDMNILVEEKVSPNPEIQKMFDKSKRVKSIDSQKQSFVDIVTSIAVETKNTFEQISDMTVFQVYATYARINAFMNYKTSTLFATVASKVEIESWNKHIDLFQEEENSMSREQFNKKFGNILGGL